MVDDAGDVGVVDVLRQLTWVVCVHDDHIGVGGQLCHDLRLFQTPVLQNKKRFGVGLAQQDGLGLDPFDLVEVPGPDNRAAGAVGVGGFVAKDEGGHMRFLAIGEVDLRAL